MKLHAVLGATLVASFMNNEASTCSFDDADVLALNISGQLAVPPELATEVRADLAAIRTAYPFLEAIHATSAWVPCTLFGELTPTAWAELGAGTYTGLDSLNQQYGPVEMSAWFGCCGVSLEFDTLYNAVILADIYSAANGVVLLSPDFIGGDPGMDIMSTGVGDYVFRSGWGDCPSGCMSEHFWSFEVRDGSVVLTGEWGDPLAVEARTWSHVKQIFRD